MRIIGLFAAVFGFVGIAYICFATECLNSPDKLPDKPNMHAQLLMQFGCGYACMNSIKYVFIGLLVIGIILVIIDYLSSHNGK